MLQRSLAKLPPPPAGTSGWPWTEESRQLPDRDSHGAPWPRLTVVTPSFNHARYIEATIRSILLQGYSALEYFIIDGASSDNTAEILAKYSPWVDRVISEPDNGQSSAINRGLQMGSGSYATWINSDDMLCKNAFWHLFSEHQLTEDAIIAGDCDEIDESGAPLRRHRGFVRSFTDLLRVKTVWESGGHLCQPEIVFPLALALRVGGLNEHNHYSMDYELWGEMLLAGASIRYTGIPTGIFRRHRGQKTEDSGRQVASTLDAAESLVARAHFLSPEVRQELRAELDAYRREYPVQIWRDSGRLARLGLPRFLVNAIRRVRCRISLPMGQPRGSAE